MSNGVEKFMPEINTHSQNYTNVNKIKESIQQNVNRKNVPIVDKRNDHLDKSSFLKLLVKQLEHQDPLEPVKDRAFIAQMAQFSALEQMHNVANSVNSLRSFQANLLVGRTVSGKDFVNGKTIKGVVDKIFFDAANQVFLKVNGRNIRLEDLSSVENSSMNEIPKNDDSMSKVK